MLTLIGEVSTSGCVTLPLDAERSRNPQEPPDAVMACAVQFIDPAPPLTIPRLCGKTVPPDATATNVKPSCESTIFCSGGLMVSVTATLIACPVFELAMRMVPV